MNATESLNETVKFRLAPEHKEVLLLISALEAGYFAGGDSGEDRTRAGNRGGEIRGVMSTGDANADWMPAAAQTLAVLRANPALWAEVRSEVDAFFAAHPEEPPTQQSRDLMTVIVFRRLTNAE